jgi:hypothetical protein
VLWGEHSDPVGPTCGEVGPEIILASDVKEARVRFNAEPETPKPPPAGWPEGVSESF